jgi:hypothetical protein
VDPLHVGIIRDVLGHSSLDMAARHYHRASADASCMKLQSIVEDIRRKSLKMQRQHGSKDAC